MDIELVKYIQGAAQAWENWRKSKKTPADQLVFVVQASAVPARAKVLWESKDYGQAFAAMRNIALVRWQTILDNPKGTTVKQFADALIDTGIVERARIRIEVDGVPGDYSEVWSTLAKVNLPFMIYALASGEITVEGMIDEVQETAQKIAKAAPSIATGLLIGGGLLLGLLIVLK